MALEPSKKMASVAALVASSAMVFSSVAFIPSAASLPQEVSEVSLAQQELPVLDLPARDISQSGGNETYVVIGDNGAILSNFSGEPVAQLESGVLLRTASTIEVAGDFHIIDSHLQYALQDAVGDNVGLHMLVSAENAEVVEDKSVYSTGEDPLIPEQAAPILELSDLGVLEDLTPRSDYIVVSSERAPIYSGGINTQSLRGFLPEGTVVHHEGIKESDVYSPGYRLVIRDDRITGEMDSISSVMTASDYFVPLEAYLEEPSPSPEPTPEPTEPEPSPEPTDEETPTPEPTEPEETEAPDPSESPTDEGSASPEPTGPDESETPTKGSDEPTPEPTETDSATENPSPVPSETTSSTAKAGAEDETPESSTGDTDDKQSLADTGASSTLALALGGLLLSAGIAIVVWKRKQRHS